MAKDKTESAPMADPRITIAMNLADLVPILRYISAAINLPADAIGHLNRLEMSLFEQQKELGQDIQPIYDPRTGKDKPRRLDKEGE